MKKTDAKKEPKKGEARARKKKGEAGLPRLDRDDWIRAARTILIAAGISRVKILILAEMLQVTTGSFYWHFRDSADLQAALLADWEDSNTRAFVAASNSETDPAQRFVRVVDVWVQESGFDPNYDSAVRDWARVSEDVAKVVQRVDNARIEIFRDIFLAMGDTDQVATVRARITYYHQVGYWAMNIKQPLDERLALRPIYISLLSGRDIPPLATG